MKINPRFSDNSADDMQIARRLKSVLQTPTLYDDVSQTMRHRSHELGVNPVAATILSNQVALAIDQEHRWAIWNDESTRLFSQTYVATKNSWKQSTKAWLAEPTSLRSALSKSQDLPKDRKYLDLGSGDCQITERIKDRLGLDIVGYDVTSFQSRTQKMKSIPYDASI